MITFRRQLSPSQSCQKIHDRDESPSLLLEGNEDAIYAPRTKAAFHLDRRDALEGPTLGAVLVEDLLQFVTGHLPADHAFAKFNDLVLRHFLLPYSMFLQAAIHLITRCNTVLPSSSHVKDNTGLRHTCGPCPALAVVVSRDPSSGMPCRTAVSSGAHRDVGDGWSRMGEYGVIRSPAAKSRPQMKKRGSQRVACLG